MMKKRRERENNAESIGVIQKKLDAFNYTPISYFTSAEHNAISSGRDRWALHEIKGIPINELSDDILDPEIDAMARLEIARAQEQHNRHIRSIKDIVDSCSSQIGRGKNILALLESDREAFIAERDRLKKLRNS